ncbi:MAG: NAD(P)H oxidoreductase YRKL (EC @ Putative NADPH-quinone reductase (modulator of drug activity B) @ Flavodoxin 2 [uncultured Thiotrichaceae bacterium]|uniref:NAD(P)H oxidoreductase YRKL @ Flavodoxin 2) n=1 Tax=uncultured Thiotrichaceae bacterium TaxID=298394 RepID=A0A6S6S109_9GAMM|nr:MAG: NAD(P)H oxidoreductase YRKL (EC @ Putative NADPH-quinone reductase (modulator of drug activity B) @ Flavodoxin 2 [uncultured Thiotrichaceae bacterium]
MKTLIVYAHPNPQSFNRAILDALVAGLQAAKHEVVIKDLYAENFDPVLKAQDLEQLQSGNIPPRIQAEQQTLLDAEQIIFIYPLWWFDRPAILKGWFDIVFTNQVAFTFNDKGVQGLLKHKKALVIITAGGSESYFQDTDAMPLIHRPVTDGTLGFCGIQDVQHKIYFDVPSLTDEKRQRILQEIEQAGKEF